MPESVDFCVEQVMSQSAVLLTRLFVFHWILEWSILVRGLYVCAHFEWTRFLSVEKIPRREKDAFC